MEKHGGCPGTQNLNLVCGSLVVYHLKVGMPFHYSTEFSRQVCQQLLAGDPIKSMSIELLINQATLFRWKKQCLIDYDRKPGVKSFQVDELARACRPIQELEN